MKLLYKSNQDYKMIYVYIFQYLIIFIKQFDLIGATTVRKKETETHLYTYDFRIHSYPTVECKYVFNEYKTSINLAIKY